MSGRTGRKRRNVYPCVNEKGQKRMRRYCPHEHVIKSDTHGEMCEECVEEECRRLLDDAIATMWWELAPLEYCHRPEDRQ